MIDADGGNVEDVVQEATLALVEDALPWFDALAGREQVFALLTADETDADLPKVAFARPGSYERNRWIGFVALGMGRRDTAASYLRRALSQWEELAATCDWVRKDPSYEPRALKATVETLERGTDVAITADGR